MNRRGAPKTGTRTRSSAPREKRRGAGRKAGASPTARAAGGKAGAREGGPAARPEARDQAPQRGARGIAQARQIERLPLAEDVAGVGKGDHAERATQEEMVLQVDLREAGAADVAAERIDQRIALVIPQDEIGRASW